ncbi:quinol:cytochrome c oxidoreductase membrane protein [Faunimonas pinastri]|uniref:Quinol:cytochrome c oxidoreductase membrane protein n=1 Tax=Faunimonas pinastri TaxID=1855383 RepID=A0A1H9LTY0_9HYPH|nr:DUF3341 domain-containing protein [Faunimonas pinastri]SER14657.1 quinol:cytochrome c oxidoreductase membrane protein [Faunimonas pinastri]
MSERDLMAEFTQPEPLMEAIRAARAEGYVRLEAYTPFSIEEMPKALGLKPSRLRVVMFVGGVIGAVAGYGLQHWSAVSAYPINTGGRPLASWPAFLIVTFEIAVLFAAVAGFAALIIRTGLTELSNPVFATRGFERVTQDRFFLRVDAKDPKFDPVETRAFLERLSPVAVNVVPT